MATEVVEEVEDEVCKHHKLTCCFPRVVYCTILQLSLVELISDVGFDVCATSWADVAIF